jgi:peroxiredoxin
MKKTILFLFVFSITIIAQPFPTVGKSYTIKYNPTEKNIFSNNSKLTLVYVYDYWGTKVAAIQGTEKLFENILSPDEGKISKVAMTLKDNLFEANIFISDSVQLLSYYFTDGNNFDYNDKKTYISYIYGQDGKPVKGARFRNVDFIIMGGGDTKDCINEIENELSDYPDYHLARFVLWSKKFENENDLNQIVTLKEAAEKEFENLKVKFPKDYEVLNSEAKVYFAFQQSLSRILMPYYQAANDKIIEIAKQIPDGKRNQTVERVYQSHLQQKKSEKFNNEIVGQPAPVFEFLSINGEKKKLSDFRGKIVLLDFWGTWCGPCVGEIPNLVKAYNKFKEKGFEIISISSDLMMKTKTEEEFKSFTKEKNMSWTQVLDDKDKTIHTLYNIAHWPTLYLVDKNGTIIKNETVLRDSELEKTLNEVFGMN